MMVHIETQNGLILERQAQVKRRKISHPTTRKVQGYDIVSAGLMPAERQPPNIDQDRPQREFSLADREHETTPPPTVQGEVACGWNIGMYRASALEFRLRA